MGFTLKTAKAVEKNVTARLNLEFDGFDYNVCKYEMEHYDINAYDQYGDRKIVEVKQRRANNWDTWFIEIKKIEAMVKEQEASLLRGENCDAYLCVVSGNSYQLYNIEDILANSYRDVVSMNKTTAEGLKDQGVKVDKPVFVFKKDLTHKTI